MRLFLFLVILSISPSAFSQACTEASFPAMGGVVNCTTLTVNNPVTIAPNDLAAPIEFIVTGDVIINANITIDGAPGTPLSIDPSNGGNGGPGASEGGGLSIGDGQSGTDFSASDGNSHVNNGVCNHGGGGGGGINEDGRDGIQCPTGALPVGARGTASGFPGAIRGGYGGGAGGAFPVGGGLYDLGGGGGGGGGLYIQSTGGTITIKNGVKISARGGRGGNAINLGGAGGGGSGGVIWFDSPTAIINKGIIDVRGGDGGVNTKVSAPRGGNGGRGGSGVFRAVVAGVITDEEGLSSFASSSSSLKSEITCGTIATKNENQNLMFQMMIGFALAMMLRILFQFRKKV